MAELIFISSGGGGGSIQDHFAPKYVVGNTLAGDPLPLQGAPFIYIPDPGDGSGIALALTQPFGPGDVWVRPGTFDLSLGIVLTLDIPSSISVRCSSRDTIIRANGINPVWLMRGVDSELHDGVVELAGGGTGVLIGGTRNLARGVRVRGTGLGDAFTFSPSASAKARDCSASSVGRGYAILGATSCAVLGCEATQIGAFGVYASDGSRARVAQCEIETLFGGVPIDVTLNDSVITSNVVDSPTPGAQIVLRGDNSTAVGNVGTASVTVRDTTGTNEVAHNL